MLLDDIPICGLFELRNHTGLSKFKLVEFVAAACFSSLMLLFFSYVCLGKRRTQKSSDAGGLGHSTSG